jgi:hypothetical protein
MSVKLTNWFPADIDPVHPGVYEVEIVCWPWPTMVNWSDKKGWDIGNDSMVKQWRGLAEQTE